MKTTSVYSCHFSSGHRYGTPHGDRDPVRPHGHDFTLRVYDVGEWSKELDEEVRAIGRELDGSTLDTMNPAAETDGRGLCRWIMERLSMRFMFVVRVEVTARQHHDYVDREVQKVR